MKKIIILSFILLNAFNLSAYSKNDLYEKIDLFGEVLENIKKDLSSAMGTSIAIEYKVEESLIGGLKMQIGSLMIDTSIKNKLKKYKQTMLETQYAN